MSCDHIGDRQSFLAFHAHLQCAGISVSYAQFYSYIVRKPGALLMNDQVLFLAPHSQAGGQEQLVSAALAVDN